MSKDRTMDALYYAEMLKNGKYNIPMDGFLQLSLPFETCTSCRCLCCSYFKTIPKHVNICLSDAINLARRLHTFDQQRETQNLPEQNNYYFHTKT